jgi:hypothetical protein
MKPLLLDGRVRVTFDAGTPAEICRALRKPLLEWGWLLPLNCHELDVYFNKPESGAAELAVGLHGEYRRARFYAGPSWLEFATAAERDAAVLHELVHIVAGEITECADALIDKLCDEGDEKLKRWATECVRRACEGTVVDLTRQLLERKRIMGRL